MDFTISTYKLLLQSLIDHNYSFQTLSDFLSSQKSRVIILRHDVEKKINHAIDFALIEQSLNIKGTYYFKFSNNSLNTNLVKQIVDLGHEIGYHYDDLAVCKGNYERAIKRFEDNLNFLRRYGEVNTVCMDGSPLSRYDNRLLWKRFRISDFGIKGEPYFDIDYNNVFYLTDTGRRWDGYKMSFRDRIDVSQKDWVNKGLIFKSTFDIIKSVNNDAFPEKALLTFHPQRWTDTPHIWINEYLFQNFKNIIKKVVLKLNNKML